MCILVGRGDYLDLVLRHSSEKRLRLSRALVILCYLPCHFRSKSVSSVQKRLQERCLNPVDTWWPVKVSIILLLLFIIIIFFYIGMLMSLLVVKTSNGYISYFLLCRGNIVPSPAQKDSRKHNVQLTFPVTFYKMCIPDAILGILSYAKFFTQWTKDIGI